VKALGEEAIKVFLGDPVPGAEVKAALGKMLKMRGKLAEDQIRLADLGKQLKAISDDQARLRANLTIIPQSAEPYKEFLQKFVAQERTIENLQGQVRQLQASVQKQQKDYEAHVSALNAE
jgi:multidrug resistance efflux pump